MKLMSMKIKYFTIEFITLKICLNLKFKNCSVNVIDRKIKAETYRKINATLT